MLYMEYFILLNLYSHICGGQVLEMIMNKAMDMLIQLTFLFGEKLKKKMDTKICGMLPE
jgi:hypothetical protein